MRWRWLEKTRYFFFSKLDVVIYRPVSGLSSVRPRLRGVCVGVCVFVESNSSVAAGA